MSSSGQITIEAYRPAHFQAIQSLVEIIQDTLSIFICHFTLKNLKAGQLGKGIHNFPSLRV